MDRYGWTTLRGIQPLFELSFFRLVGTEAVNQTAEVYSDAWHVEKHMWAYTA